ALTVDANGSNTIGLGGISTGDILLGGGSGSTGCTLTNSTGDFACTGNITGSTLNGTTGVNTGAGAGTQRIENAGHLVNIGNVTTSGASTFTTTGANGFTFKPGSDNSAAFRLQNAGGSPEFSIDTTNSNMITNPSFETNTTGWAAHSGSGAPAQDATEKYI